MMLILSLDNFVPNNHLITCMFTGRILQCQVDKNLLRVPVKQGRKVCINAHHKLRRIDNLWNVIIFWSTRTIEIRKTTANTREFCSL